MSAFYAEDVETVVAFLNDGTGGRKEEMYMLYLPNEDVKRKLIEKHSRRPERTNSTFHYIENCLCQIKILSETALSLALKEGARRVVAALLVEAKLEPTEENILLLEPDIQRSTVVLTYNDVSIPISLYAADLLWVDNKLWIGDLIEDDFEGDEFEWVAKLDALPDPDEYTFAPRDNFKHVGKMVYGAVCTSVSLAGKVIVQPIDPYDFMASFCEIVRGVESGHILKQDDKDRFFYSNNLDEIAIYRSIESTD